MIWKHPSFGPPKEFTAILSVKKITATICSGWDHKDVLLVDLLDCHDTVSAEC
jgi:hypothetical protein